MMPPGWEGEVHAMGFELVRHKDCPRIDFIRDGLRVSWWPTTGGTCPRADPSTPHDGPHCVDGLSVTAWLRSLLGNPYTQRLDFARTKHMVRVGLDMVRATAAFRHEVLRRVAIAGARPVRVVLTVGARSPMGPREVVYPVVNVDADADDAALTVAVEAWIPKDRVAPIQWTLTRPGDAHLHVVATGVETWLVIAGDIAPEWNPVNPDDGGSDGAGDAGTETVVEFRRAA